ncbi:MAG TPA: hypothetical protein PKO06_11405 [Candidatus Ozemobacteraceae bacterium]|nr:hypothetical protein [Candidatus Ozemobacteraceae bacterium]
MRKLVVVLAVFLTVLCVPVWAETEGSDKDDLDLSPAAGGAKKQISADSIISKIKERKEKLLARIRQRFERMPERMRKMEEKVDKMSNRVSKAPKGDGEQGGVDRKAQMKAKITERYEKFKGMISERKNKLGTKFDERKAKFQEKIGGKLKAEDMSKVMAEFESAQKEVVAEVEKLLTEAQKKLDETYQKLLTKLN